MRSSLKNLRLLATCDDAKLYAWEDDGGETRAMIVRGDERPDPDKLRYPPQLLQALVAHLDLDEWDDV